MSHTPHNIQDLPVEPVSVITLTLHLNNALNVQELQNFDRLARMRGLSRDGLLAQLIREELAEQTPPTPPAAPQIAA